MIKIAPVSILAIASVLTFPVRLASQPVSFAGVTTQLPITGLSGPRGMAVDAAGNLFIADSKNNRILKVPAGGGSPLVVVTGLSTPNDVAVDASGNLFIADTYADRLVEFPASGGPLIVLYSSGGFITGVAVDGQGNVYAIDESSRLLVKAPSGGGTAVTTPVNARTPFGVAVDAAGNVFVSSYMDGTLIKFPAGGGTPVQIGSAGLPEDVAVDAAGNVYVAATGNSTVVQFPSGGGTPVTIASGSVFWGVAVDQTGAVLVSDTTNRILKIQSSAPSFGTINVCPGSQATPAPCNQTLTLTYNVTGTVTFGPARALTQGAPNLDFNVASNTCAGSHNAGDLCTVGITFAPLSPGVRKGAVQLTDSAGNILVTTLVSGQGQGPAISFNPGIPSGLTFASPRTVALDGFGNLFVGDSGGNVFEVSTSGARTLISSGLQVTDGLTVDGAGNLFVCSRYDGLFKIPYLGNGYGPRISLPSPPGPVDVAVDGAGNVFVTGLSGTLVKISQDGNQSTLASGFSLLQGLAVDGAGNIFVSDSTNNRVVRIAPGGTQSTILNSRTYSLALDAAGNLFATDPDGSMVWETPAGSSNPFRFGFGFGNPLRIAISPTGDLFIADINNNRVVKIQRSQPPALTFLGSQVGVTSSDSPRSVLIQNIGNQSLNATPPGLTVSSNFFPSPGSSGFPDCTAGFALVSGAFCDLSLSFKPQTTGPISGSAVLTDNALNANAATQTISLQGTGLFTFTGFLSPVANQPTVNSAKAGQAVPMKFSLGGNQGLNIFAAGYPQVKQVTCGTGAGTGNVVEGDTSGNSGLSYDETSQTYTYLWNTQKSFANTCQQFVIRLTDGTYHVADFQFK